MIILGAGLAGLLAGNMLRRFNPTIYEAQASLPNNHAALLRFRTDACAIAFSIPFKKVKVYKAVCYKGKLMTSPTLQLMNMYSEKVTGEYMSRSLDDLRPAERWIAPSKLIEQAAKQLKIDFGKVYSGENVESQNTKISTIPMDKMMDIVNWEERPEFKHLPIYTYTCDIAKPTNLYQTIYYPGDEPYYRCSITGNRLIVECTEECSDLDKNRVLRDFGIYSDVINASAKYQKYGKLLPIDDRLRKRFILHLTEEYGIYSLGRFATWRQILLDDVVNDVNVIEGLMNGSSYERKRSAA